MGVALDANVLRAHMALAASLGVPLMLSVLSTLALALLVALHPGAVFLCRRLPLGGGLAFLRLRRAVLVFERLTGWLAGFAFLRLSGLIGLAGLLSGGGAVLAAVLRALGVSLLLLAGPVLAVHFFRLRLVGALRGLALFAGLHRLLPRLFLAHLLLTRALMPQALLAGRLSLRALRPLAPLHRAPLHRALSGRLAAMMSVLHLLARRRLCLPWLPLLPPRRPSSAPRPPRR